MSVSERFNLEKSQANLERFVLAKGLTVAPTLRVGVALDISGSMSYALSSGAVQQVLNKLVPVSLKFDDNGELDLFKFDNRCEHVGTVDATNYSDYITRKGVKARGGTEYAPIIRAARQYFFPKTGGGFFSKVLGGGKPADKTPALMLILTDGECSDARQVDRELQDAKQDNIYWHFVGVGSDNFRTIKQLADKHPHVGDVYLRSFDVSDDELYQQIICDELVEWVKGV